MAKHETDNLLLFAAAIVTVLFMSGFLVETDMMIYHLLSAVLGMILIFAAFGIFRKWVEFRFVIIGIVLLSLTHMNALIGFIAGMSEYNIGVVDHILFFVGILFVMHGMLIFKNEHSHGRK